MTNILPAILGQHSSLPSISSSLTQALRVDTEWFEPPAVFEGYLNDGSEHWVFPKAYEREIGWSMPKKINEDLKAEASLFLEHLDPFMKPANLHMVGSWINDLASIKKKNANSNEALTAQICCISDQLEIDGFPCACFCPQTISIVAQEIEWFGDYGDIAKSLKKILFKFNRDVCHLKMIACFMPPKNENSELNQIPFKRKNERCNGKEFYRVLKSLYQRAGKEYPGDEKAKAADLI